MGDYIRIGLDFGTHQTKVCVQRTPDEGHGHPVYEFFKFKDLKGKDNFFLPSIVQINDDDTLSYGFIDSQKERSKNIEPILKPLPEPLVFDEESEFSRLVGRYFVDGMTEKELNIIKSIVKERHKTLSSDYQKELARIKEENAKALSAYKGKRDVFRYFKQATFSEREWPYPIDYRLISIWYLSFVIICLEDKYGQNFSINMGIPASYDTFENKKREAISILSSAYKLVEEVYKNDKESFMSESIDNLINKTVIVPFSKEYKEFFGINIFPEAYASMAPLTSREKITRGMCLAVDIGGGTTDVSFFTIKDQKPQIYKFWTIHKGLNYIAEQSGYDYQNFNFDENAEGGVIRKYNSEKTSLIDRLYEDLTKAIKEKDKYKSQIRLRLENGVVVYNGGGSIYGPLTTGMKTYFNDVKIIEGDMWKEENIIDMDKVVKYCKILTTSYGLSLCRKDDEVILHDYNELFSFLGIENESSSRVYIDKDMV